MSGQETSWAIKAKMYLLDTARLTTVLERVGITVKSGAEKYACLETLESYIKDCGTDTTKGEKKLQVLLAAVSESEVEIEGTPPTCNTTPAPAPRSDKKEFKIHGLIGKEGISFVNLIRQIDSGEKRSYSVTEIIDGVIRAISSTEPLRGYIEGKTNLSLPILRKLLRSYFQERSATELYQEPSCGVQGQKEETLHFVWRMLDLGQKVTFSCLEEGSDIAYDETLVRRMTLRAILTGLRDQLIAHELKSTLTSNPNDDEVVCQVGAAVSAEKERHRKNAQSAGVKLLVPESSKSEEESDETLQILKNLQAQVAELRVGAEPRQPRSRQLCPKCKEAERTTCDHCFQCGSSKHFLAGCKQRCNRRWGSGNDRESATSGTR